MVRVTLVSNKKKPFEKLIPENLIGENPELPTFYSDPVSDETPPKPSHNNNNLLFEMTLNQFVEVTNILQCLFELTEKKKCHFSNVSSNPQGGDATSRRETIWPRLIKPKRVVTCGRKTLLAWVNKELTEGYTDLSQLNDGVAFCRLVNNLAPGIIPKSKIKFYVGITRWSDNYKILQQAFYDLKLDRALPGKGRDLNQKDILVFTSWLKALFEVNARERPEAGTGQEEGVGDTSSCKDSGCGSGSGSDSEERLTNVSQLKFIDIEDEIDNEVAKSDVLENLKPNKKKIPFRFNALKQTENHNPCRGSRPQIPKIPTSIPTQIRNGMILKNSYPRINFISPKRFTACGRKTLLTWISGELSRDILDLTQLSDGTAYCLLINLLSPDTIPVKRISFKIDPFTHQDNYNLLQASFRYHKVRKTIPVKKLIEQNTKEILLFTNWLKAFFELNRISITKTS